MNKPRVSDKICVRIQTLRLMFWLKKALKRETRQFLSSVTQ